MANEEVCKAINTLEDLVIGLSFSIPPLIKQGGSDLVYLANESLDKALKRLSDYYILKGIVSKKLEKNDVYETCIYRALILNPSIKIKTEYILFVPSFEIYGSSSSKVSVLQSQSIFTIEILDITEDSAFLNSAKNVFVESPEKALELCKYN